MARNRLYRQMNSRLRQLFDSGHRDRLREVLHWCLIAAICVGAWGWVGYNWYSGRKADREAYVFLREELLNDSESEYALIEKIGGGDGFNMGIIDYERPKLFGGYKTMRLVMTTSDGAVASAMAVRAKQQPPPNR